MSSGTIEGWDTFLSLLGTYIMTLCRMARDPFLQAKKQPDHSGVVELCRLVDALHKLVNHLEPQRARWHPDPAIVIAALCDHLLVGDVLAEQRQAPLVGGIAQCETYIPDIVLVVQVARAERRS